MKKCISLFLSVLMMLLCASSALAEGTLVLYTARSDAEIAAIVPEFESQTGITVEIITGGVGELIKRIEAEGEKPLGDVLLGGTRSSNEPSAKLFADYLSPEAVNLYPAYQHEDGSMSTVAVTACCLIVNNNLIGDIQVKGFEDLINPALKGKIAFADPSASSNAYLNLINMLYVMGEGDYEKGWDSVEKFAKNLDGKLLSSSFATPRGVADGEYTVGLSHELYAASCIREGAPVSAVYYAEGCYVGEEVVSIIAGGPNPESAQKFIDYLLGVDFQTRNMQATDARSPRQDVAVPNGLPSLNDINSVGELSPDPAMKQVILEKFRDLVFE